MRHLQKKIYVIFNSICINFHINVFLLSRLTNLYGICCTIYHDVYLELVRLSVHPPDSFELIKQESKQKCNRHKMNISTLATGLIKIWYEWSVDQLIL